VNKSITDFPIHPFLLGIFPVILLYENNIYQVEITEILLPSFLLISVISIVIFCCYLVHINLNKTALFLSITMFLNFSYMPVRELFINIHIFTLPRIGYPEYIAAIYIAIFLLSAYFIVRTKKSLTGITKILNLISVILFFTVFLYIGSIWISSDDYVKNIPTTTGEKNFSGNSLQTSDKDIYYLIPDRYPGAETLQVLYQYDNSPFINNLTKRGFCVINHSRSNYGETILSIPSSLNMQYLNEPLTQERMAKKIENNDVMKFLKNQGYTIVFFRSTYLFTNENQNADIEYNDRYVNPENEFQANLKMNSLFYRLFVRGCNFFGFRILEAQHADVNTYSINTLSNLSKIPKLPGKKFVFAHFEIPNYIDTNNSEEFGNGYQNNPHENDERYTANLNYFNLLFEKTIDEIINTSTIQPIIIIQSDHGAMYRSGIDDPAFIQQWTYLDSDDYIPNNFNAYYLPDGGDSILYPNITPVNSFRLIFNYYFNTSYEKLEDKTYIRGRSGVREIYWLNSTY
jgi:hypothetical protein